MKGEIDKDFYCSSFSFFNGICGLGDRSDSYCGKENCPSYHRKHPTPEQFKKEYGEDVPDGMLVYVDVSWLVLDDGQLVRTYSPHTYGKYKDIVEMGIAKYGFYEVHGVYCACTPFAPKKDRRPE